ncbi:MobF family relaxase [Gluconacetobacter diazotrophicus]|uniref:MobF family relaxase n=1 Tax=Gluconacetobacter diazotrophicus TaxID=33996 RepID=UPI00119A786A|nr:MobF family relaxase [Gluconacetobacter diazotrophicus]TWB05630.1 conjugative relaxase-like TrwC/TraI family protein [Gluconacetobacter diazotrophicus]
MFTCTPLSSVEYYIESVNQELVNQAGLGGSESDANQNEAISQPGRKRGDWSDRDRASYYLDNGTGEKPGVWWTNARVEVGQAYPFVIDGAQVDSKDFRNLAAGRDPLTQDILVQQGKGRRVGYDLQFAAPKTVSVLWASGDRNQRDAIEDSQQEAVFKALDYIQKNGLIVTRRGKNGNERETPEELMAGTFLHTTSRSGDPQIHTHAVLMNVCRRADGTTGTIDNLELLKHQQEIGAIYRLALIEGLERRLGVTAVKDERNFRILGVPESLEQKVSKRRDDIVAEAREMGIDTATHRDAAENISRNTRGSKDDLPIRAELNERWDREIREEGWTKESVWESALAATADKSARPSDTKSAFERALDQLTSTETVIEDRHLIGTILEHWQGRSMTVDDAIAMAVASRKSERLIELTGNDQTKTRELVFATAEIIDMERQIVRIAIKRKAEGQRVPDDLIEAAIARKGTISDEQAELVRHALNRDGIAIVEGSAGTGKSFSLGTAAEAARGAGLRVWVTAPSHQAVSVIAKDTDTDQTQSAVLRSFLNRISDPEHKQRIRLSWDDVVIVDEAGMVGTREMNELLKETAKAGAKVILSGDTQQLKPVAPGSPLRLISETVGTERINQIRRQKVDWQRQASQHFAAGDVERAVNAYAGHDRIVIGEGQGLRNKLIEDYLGDVRGNPTGTRMVLARTHNEVKALNTDLRNLLRQEGQIAGLDIEIEALSRGLKPVAGSLSLATGDRLIFGENIRGGGNMIRNNDVATVKSVCRDNADGEPVVTLAFDRGFEVTTRWSDLERLSRSKENELDTRPLRVQHAYAVTIHSAQGASVDRSFVLNAAGMDREALYVGMTRHKEDCHLYTDVTRIGINVRDNRIRRDGVKVQISDSGKLEAPDAQDKDDAGDRVNRETVIRQVIYEGQKSREKGNAADFSVDRMAWALSRTAQDAVEGDIDRRQVMQERIMEEGPSDARLAEDRKDAWADTAGNKEKTEKAGGVEVKADDKSAARAEKEATERMATEARRQAEEEARKCEMGRGMSR